MADLLGNVYSLETNLNEKHYFVVIAESNETVDMFLLLSFSSVKYLDNGIEKSFDDSCVFDKIDNIVDFNRTLIIYKKSYIVYGRPMFRIKNSLIDRKLCVKLNSKLLNKIISGAKKSKYVPPYLLKEYFK